MCKVTLQEMYENSKYKTKIVGKKIFKYLWNVHWTKMKSNIEQWVIWLRLLSLLIVMHRLITIENFTKLFRMREQTRVENHLLNMRDLRTSRIQLTKQEKRTRNAFERICLQCRARIIENKSYTYEKRRGKNEQYTSI